MDYTRRLIFTGLVMFLIAAVAFAILLLGLGIRLSTVGDGRHTGFITAVEQEGLIFPNYRVYVKTDNSSSQEDVYCVDRRNKELADKLRNFSTGRQLVSISYSGVKGIGFDLCNGEEIKDVTIDPQ